MPTDPELLLADLLQADDEGTLVEFLLTTMAVAAAATDTLPAAAALPVTDWNSGGIGLTLIRADAKAQAELAALLVDIAKGGILGLSKGGWLTLLARSGYQLARTAATFAKPHVRLLCAASAGPYTITPGQLRYRTPDGRKYSSANATNQTLPSGGSLDLDFQAESPGSGYNLTLSDSITPETPLNGVTFALQETFAGSGSCMTAAGEDEESDDSLEQRCRERWASLGVEKTYDAYTFLATNAKDADSVPIAGVSKVLVDDTNPDGPGTVRIYLAGDDGAVTDPQTVSDVDAYLQKRKGLCALLTTQGAVDDVITVRATVKCRAERIGDAKTAVKASLKALQAELAIGDGNGAALDPVGKLYWSRLEAILKDAPGVVDVSLTNPVTSYLPAKGHIVKLDYSVDGGAATITFTAT